MKVLLLVCLAILPSCQSPAESAHPIETGTVKWSRDLDTSLKASKKTSRPVFLLFQEVPG
ncbi:MAG: hypothetical protein ACON5H_01190 [Akkermansiaceae bacterium]